jgi:hypothetical protein
MILYQYESKRYLPNARGNMFNDDKVYKEKHYFNSGWLDFETSSKICILGLLIDPKQTEKFEEACETQHSEDHIYSCVSDQAIVVLLPENCIEGDQRYEIEDKPFCEVVFCYRLY